MGSSGSSLIRRFDIKRAENGRFTRLVDTVAAEEPLEIRLQYWFKDSQLTTSLALTMRTPGHDLELAAGYLLTEGVIGNREHLAGLRAIGIEPSNEVLAELAREVDVEAWRLARNSFLSASCGICGKRSREAMAAQTPPVPQSSVAVTSNLIDVLPGLLRQHQEGFAQTGGLHAAALVSPEGEIKSLFEDIGRHNALDKLIGSELLAGRTPLSNAILFLSSRSSFELIQKAAMAGASVLATVGGPSSLAVEAARELGITLLGFVRDGRCNIYSGDWRVH